MWCNEPTDQSPRLNWLNEHSKIQRESLYVFLSHSFKVNLEEMRLGYCLHTLELRPVTLFTSPAYTDHSAAKTDRQTDH